MVDDDIVDVRVDGTSNADVVRAHHHIDSSPGPPIAERPDHRHRYENVTDPILSQEQDGRTVTEVERHTGFANADRFAPLPYPSVVEGPYGKFEAFDDTVRHP